MWSLYAANLSCAAFFAHSRADSRGFFLRSSSDTGTFFAAATAFLTSALALVVAWNLTPSFSAFTRAFRSFSRAFKWAFFAESYTFCAALTGANTFLVFLTTTRFRMALAAFLAAFFAFFFAFFASFFILFFTSLAVAFVTALVSA